MRWSHEPDERPKRGHHWDRSEARFHELPAGEVVGKCPSTLSLADAQLLLDEAVRWQESRCPGPHPSRLYSVHEGVLYRATPTVPGRSYHGFPEHPDRSPRALRGQRGDRRLAGP